MDLTDTPGEHNVELIRQMTANTVQGDTVVLRTQTVGRSTQPYVAYDALRLLRIATYHGYARTRSSLLGVFLTPLLVGLLLGANAHVDASAVLRIFGLLLLPFVLGQLSRRWLRPWLVRHDRGLRRFDRSTVLLVVYSGFSQGTNADLWSGLRWTDALVVAGVCVALLAVASVVCWAAGRGFDRGARIAVYFCGTNKLLAR